MSLIDDYIIAHYPEKSVIALAHDIGISIVAANVRVNNLIDEGRLEDFRMHVITDLSTEIEALTYFIDLRKEGLLVDIAWDRLKRLQRIKNHY